MSFSNLQNPTHTYVQPGTYTVSLTVTGPGGTDTNTKIGYIVVTSGGIDPYLVTPWITSPLDQAVEVGTPVLTPSYGPNLIQNGTFTESNNPATPGDLYTAGHWDLMGNDVGTNGLNGSIQQTIRRLGAGESRYPGIIMGGVGVPGHTMVQLIDIINPVDAYELGMSIYYDPDIASMSNDVVFDTFVEPETSQTFQSTAAVVGGVYAEALPGTLLGGYRGLYLHNPSVIDPGASSVTVGSGLLQITNTPVLVNSVLTDVTSEVTVVWDGDVTSAYGIVNTAGLGSQDLTLDAGGTNTVDRLRFSFQYLSQGTTITVTVWSGGGLHSSSLSYTALTDIDTSATPPVGTPDVDFIYSQFTGDAVFIDISAIQLHITGPNNYRVILDQIKRIGVVTFDSSRFYVELSANGSNYQVAALYENLYLNAATVVPFTPFQYTPNDSPIHLQIEAYMPSRAMVNVVTNGDLFSATLDENQRPYLAPRWWFYKNGPTLTQFPDENFVGFPVLPISRRELYPNTGSLGSIYLGPVGVAGATAVAMSGQVLDTVVGQTYILQFNMTYNAITGGGGEAPPYYNIDSAFFVFAIPVNEVTSPPDETVRLNTDNYIFGDVSQADSLWRFTFTARATKTQLFFLARSQGESLLGATSYLLGQFFWPQWYITNIVVQPLITEGWYVTDVVLREIINDETINCDLTSSAFTVVNGTDTHVSSSWQVATDAGFTDVVFQSNQDNTHLTGITVNALLPNTGYHARVLYTGAVLGSTPYSDAVHFTTKDRAPVIYKPTVAFPVVGDIQYMGPVLGTNLFGLNTWTSNNAVTSPTQITITGNGSGSQTVNVEAGKAYILSYTVSMTDTALLAEVKIDNTAVAAFIHISSNKYLAYMFVPAAAATVIEFNVTMPHGSVGQTVFSNIAVQPYQEASVSLPLTADFNSSPFTLAVGSDTHVSSTWRIYDNAGQSISSDTLGVPNLTHWSPANFFVNKSYYVSVQYTGNRTASIESNRVAFSTPTGLYPNFIHGVAGNLWYSTDYGVTYQVRSYPQLNMSFVDIATNASGNILAGAFLTDNSARILFSPDKGSTWMTPDVPHLNEIVSHEPPKVWHTSSDIDGWYAYFTDSVDPGHRLLAYYGYAQHYNANILSINRDRVMDLFTDPAVAQTFQSTAAVVGGVYDTALAMLTLFQGVRGLYLHNPTVIDANASSVSIINGTLTITNTPVLVNSVLTDVTSEVTVVWDGDGTSTFGNTNTAGYGAIVAKDFTMDSSGNVGLVDRFRVTCQYLSQGTAITITVWSAGGTQTSSLSYVATTDISNTDIDFVYYDFVGNAVFTDISAVEMHITGPVNYSVTLDKVVLAAAVPLDPSYYSKVWLSENGILGTVDLVETDTGNPITVGLYIQDIVQFGVYVVATVRLNSTVALSNPNNIPIPTSYVRWTNRFYWVVMGTLSDIGYTLPGSFTTESLPYLDEPYVGGNYDNVRARIVYPGATPTFGLALGHRGVDHSPLEPSDGFYWYNGNVNTADIRWVDSYWIRHNTGHDADISGRNYISVSTDGVTWIDDAPISINGTPVPEVVIPMEGFKTLVYGGYGNIPFGTPQLMLTLGTVGGVVYDKLLFRSLDLSGPATWTVIDLGWSVVDLQSATAIIHDQSSILRGFQHPTPPQQA